MFIPDYCGWFQSFSISKWTKTSFAFSNKNGQFPSKLSHEYFFFVENLQTRVICGETYFLLDLEKLVFFFNFFSLENSKLFATKFSVLSYFCDILILFFDKVTFFNADKITV